METGEGMEKDEMDIKNINIQREATVKRGETANERFIPIEVIGPIEEEDYKESSSPVDIPSNRTSLIITHEDGSVEEEEGEVTCLGLTPDHDRRSKVLIEEVLQENFHCTDPEPELSDEALNLSPSKESNCVEGEVSGEQSTQNSDDVTSVIEDKIQILEPLATPSFQANTQIDIQGRENAYNEKKRASEDERISDPVTEIRKSKSEEPRQEKENIDFEITELEAELLEVCAAGPPDMKNVNITDTDSASTTSNEGQTRRSTSGESLREQTEERPPLSGVHTCPTQGAQDNQLSRQVSRTIPINIQTKSPPNTLENGEDLKDTDQVKGVKIRNIPIEIISYEAEPPMTKVPENSGPSSARTIPIQRISKNNVRTTPSMARTPSRESLGSSTNKIKMGTSAIRIPIQVQRSSENWQEVDRTAKPPHNTRTVPILRQSLSDSGVGQPISRLESASLQDEKSENTLDEKLRREQILLEDAKIRSAPSQDEKSENLLQKVHQELEEAKLKVGSQADILSRGFEHIVSPSRGKTDWRSRSLDNSSGNRQSLKREEVKVPLHRERSLQDINKDIETIWKELQDLDRPLINERDDKNRTPPGPIPLSEQVLVTPSWRSSQSASNPSITTSSSSYRRQRHTIWDVPETGPSYFPTKSNNHFSFLPKAETRPGSITPAYSPSSRPPVSKARREAATESLNTDTSQIKKSHESRKPCLKSQSTQSLKSRSQSPTVVKFSPKLPARCPENKKSAAAHEPDPPFEWIEFRRADGEIVKGTILPPLGDNSEDKFEIREDREDRARDGMKVYEEVVPRRETKQVCHAETQTEKHEGKGGCSLM